MDCTYHIHRDTFIKTISEKKYRKRKRERGIIPILFHVKIRLEKNGIKGIHVIIIIRFLHRIERISWQRPGGEMNEWNEMNSGNNTREHGKRKKKKLECCLSVARSNII